MLHVRACSLVLCSLDTLRGRDRDLAIRIDCFSRLEVLVDLTCYLLSPVILQRPEPLNSEDLNPIQLLLSLQTETPEKL